MSGTEFAQDLPNAQNGLITNTGRAQMSPVV